MIGLLVKALDRLSESLCLNLSFHIKVTGLNPTTASMYLLVTDNTNSSSVVTKFVPDV